MSNLFSPSPMVCNCAPNQCCYPSTGVCWRWTITAVSFHGSLFQSIQGLSGICPEVSVLHSKGNWVSCLAFPSESLYIFVGNTDCLVSIAQRQKPTTSKRKKVLWVSFQSTLQGRTWGCSFASASTRNKSGHTTVILPVRSIIPRCLGLLDLGLKVQLTDVLHVPFQSCLMLYLLETQESSMDIWEKAGEFCFWFFFWEGGVSSKCGCISFAINREN